MISASSFTLLLSLTLSLLVLSSSSVPVDPQIVGSWILPNTMNFLNFSANGTVEGELLGIPLINATFVTNSTQTPHTVFISFTPAGLNSLNSSQMFTNRSVVIAAIYQVNNPFFNSSTNSSVTNPTVTNSTVTNSTVTNSTTTTNSTATNSTTTTNSTATNSTTTTNSTTPHPTTNNSSLGETLWFAFNQSVNSILSGVAIPPTNFTWSMTIPFKSFQPSQNMSVPSLCEPLYDVSCSNCSQECQMICLGGKRKQMQVCQQKCVSSFCSIICQNNLYRPIQSPSNSSHSHNSGNQSGGKGH